MKRYAVILSFVGLNSQADDFHFDIAGNNVPRIDRPALQSPETLSKQSDRTPSEKLRDVIRSVYICTATMKGIIAELQRGVNPSDGRHGPSDEKRSVEVRRILLNKAALLKASLESTAPISDDTRRLGTKTLAESNVVLDELDKLPKEMLALDALPR